MSNKVIDKTLQNIVRKLMYDNLKARGMNSRLEKKLLKHWAKSVDADLFKVIPASHLNVLSDEGYNSKYKSDKKATKVFESYVKAVCDLLQAQHPNTVPLKIDPRNVKPLWQKPLIETVNMITLRASLNQSLKSISDCSG